MAEEPLDLQGDEGEEYGSTIALTSVGDLRQNDLYGFQEIHDVQAVVQDLKVALLTPQGVDPMRPEYGLDIIRERDENPEFSAIGTSDAEFRVAIRECIGPRADDRVSSIDEIEINRPPGERSNVDVVITITLEQGPQTRFSFTPQILEN